MHHGLRTVGQAGSTSLVFFYKIFKERYSVYWRLSA